MPSKKILIVHPYVRTTFFLKRIKNFLQQNISDEVHYFSVKPNDNSHFECLEKIKSLPENGLIIFLGHGRTDCLLGARTDKSIATVSELARSENPQDYYNNEKFISKDNINVFSKKKVFCLACNSNSKISDYAIQEGSQVFLGFGDIPTTLTEFYENKSIVSQRLLSLMKAEINYIIKKSLLYAITNNVSFESLQGFICFLTSQRIAYILKRKRWFKERHLLADYLYYFKKDVLIKGNKTVKLLD